jgi:hypothetical protein
MCQMSLLTELEDLITTAFYKHSAPYTELFTNTL